eukprot:SM000079S22487  [mRNA]  locus=s79:397638:399317:- [translate_table: standard]
MPGTFEDTSLEDMHQVVDTNLWGAIHLVKAALPSLREASKLQGPGSITLVSSQAGQVGVYGYSHYSASKFALRGLAEVLQQELLPDNIRMCLVFPPDTNTPGLEEEDKTKPEITKILSTSKAVDAMAVAKPMVLGIKTGRFFVSANFDGFMLNLLNAGMAPQPFFSTAILEICLGGVMRIVALIVLSGWTSTIRKWHRFNLCSSQPLPCNKYIMLWQQA